MYFTATLLTQIYVTVVIILTFEKHLHDRTSSIRCEVWARKTNLTSSLLIMPITSQENDICVLWVSNWFLFLPFVDWMIE